MAGKQAGGDPMLGWFQATARELEGLWRRAEGLEGWALERWPEGIFLAGVGGSAMAGRLLAALLGAEAPVPVTVATGLRLPGWLGPEGLAVVASYSGETWEALHLLGELERRRVPWVGLGSGGALAERARAQGRPFLPLPAGRAPRSMSLVAAAGLLALFRRLLPRLEAEMEEALAGFREDLAAWDLEGTDPGAPSPSGPWPVLPRDPRVVAGRLLSRFPLFYGWGDLGEAVAYRWASQLAENAKTPAHHHRWPEALHNEIVAWASWARINPAPILLYLETGSPPSLREATPGGTWEGVWEELRAAGLEAWRLPAPEGGHLAGTLRQALLGDAVSILLARWQGVEPTPVEAIERLKEATRRETSRENRDEEHRP
jgi:glucose/mannose-6-phosphate isomerase